MIAQLADGCQRDANKYLDQVSVLGEVTADNVAQYLGVVGDSTLASVCDAVMHYQTSQDSADADAVIVLLESLRDKSIDLMALPRQLLVYCDRQFATNPV
jgi:DNA polymerase III gamma/tau subunit